MWVFKIFTTFIQKCVMPVLCCDELSNSKEVSTDDLDYSNASYMNQSWLGHAWYVECIVFLNQCKVALNGYALKDFMNLVVMH